MVVGIFSCETREIEQLRRNYEKSGKLVVFSKKTPNTLVLLKNGLAIGAQDTSEQLSREFTSDPYPAILREMLVTLYEKTNE